MDMDEISDEIGTGKRLTLRDLHVHFLVFFRGTKTVNTGDRGNDDHILSGEECLGRGVAQAVDLFVDHCLFLDIRVGHRHISLGLVEVVIRDEIVHGIVREELAVLLRKLRSESFVVCNNKRRLPNVSNHIRCSEGFARARHTEERLVAQTFLHTFSELFDSLRLISSGLELVINFEN